MSDIVRFAGVSKRYGREVALDDVSFAVPSGSVTALLGENGAGKTTALRIALGLARPDSGAATTLGMPAETPEARRRIGYVPDAPELFEWMTVAETGWFAAGFYPPGFEVRFKKRIDAFELAPSRKVSGLTKGMRARLGLALALAQDPDLLLLDEPTSGLDPAARRMFLEVVADAAADGKTVLLASHALHEVERIADRIIILRRGRVALDAELELLKAGAVEAVVRFEDRPATGAPIPIPPGTLLDRIDHERESRLLLTGAPPDIERILEYAAGVADVQVRTLNLEEVFLSLSRAQHVQSPALVATRAVS
ncbi:MAG TPA: ABC transporter ATP-binding protein [Planctomycetia bacterium]|nr:ABC transporter ATP-binding protein [Planctomycetia bacterium]